MRTAADRGRTLLRKVASVFRDPRYAVLALVTAVLTYSTYAILLNRSVLLSAAGSGDIGLLLTLVPTLVTGYAQTTSTLSIAMTAVTALLVGVNVGVVVYRLIELSGVGREGLGTAGGVAVAAVAPACPACATAIVAVAGASTVFGVLPFHGAELQVAGIVVLAGSAAWITAQIDKDYCEFC